MEGVDVDLGRPDEETGNYDNRKKIRHILRQMPLFALIYDSIMRIISLCHGHESRRGQ